MRIGVMSDSHGDRASLDRLLDAMGKMDALCFLGDIASDGAYLQERLCARGADTAFYAVRGNNDLASPLPDELTLTIAGKRIFLTHGHMQRVKSGLLNLTYAARERSADVALFGHTHMRCCQYELGGCSSIPARRGWVFSAASGRRPPCWRSRRTAACASPRFARRARKTQKSWICRLTPRTFPAIILICQRETPRRELTAYAPVAQLDRATAF